MVSFISIWVYLNFFVFLSSIYSDKFCRQLFGTCFVTNLLLWEVESLIISFFVGFCVGYSNSKVQSDSHKFDS